MNAYELLRSRCEQHARLAEAGDWDAAASVAADLERLRRTLPPVPPPSARDDLLRAAAATQRSQAAAAAALDAVGRERDLLDRRRSVVHAYQRA